MENFFANSENTRSKVNLYGKMQINIYMQKKIGK